MKPRVFKFRKMWLVSYGYVCVMYNYTTWREAMDKALEVSRW